MADDKTPSQQVRDLEARYHSYWSHFHSGMDEDDAFLDGDRYVQNEDWKNRDRRLIQIRGRETEDTIRHIVAGWSLKPRNLQARPIDSDGDPATAEIMLALVQHELSTPYKDFEGELYKAVMASQEHSCGIVWMDWHPDFGPWGEFFHTEEDARDFMWDPCYHPHHPLNNWLIRKKRVQIDLAREMYNAPNLQPDRKIASRVGRADQPLMRSAGGNIPEPNDDSISLWQCWYKNDRSKAYRDSGRPEDLPKGDRYMACASGCGFRSPRQSDLSQQLPAMLENGCPTCGGNLERIDSTMPQEAIYAYSRGKRLVIIPQFPQGDDEPLYDGKWPVPRARSYPGCFVFAQVRSQRPFGGSQVSWAWDQQIASDQLSTMAVQQVFESRPLYIFPSAGLKDSRGRRFERRDDQSNIAFRDDSQTLMRPQTVERYEGSGLDSGWQVAYQSVQAKLTQYSAKLDLGLTEQSSKDIPVGTLQQLTQQVELANADFTKRTRRAVSQYAGVVSDYISGTYTPQRLSRLNIQGTDMVMKVWGQDLPSFDFEIEDSPDFTGLEKSRADALQMLEQIPAKYPGVPPEALQGLIEAYAEEMHFPPSVVKKFVDALMQVAGAQQQAMQQQQQQQMQAAAMGGQGGPNEAAMTPGMVPGAQG